MISKILLGFFSVFLLLQISSVYADEKLPIITIDFVSGDVIDLDEDSTMIRANIQIQNYDPQDGYHFMQIIRLSDGEIIKDTEILPKVIEDNLYGVQILHYLDPDQNKEEILGDYGLRVYSEYGSSETISTFSIVKSSMPLAVTQNTIEKLEIPEEIVEPENIENLESEIIAEPESKIPSWVHDIFIWYANNTITENELLTALEYLIAQGILNVNSD